LCIKEDYRGQFPHDEPARNDKNLTKRERLRNTNLAGEPSSVLLVSATSDRLRKRKLRFAVRFRRGGSGDGASFGLVLRFRLTPGLGVARSLLRFSGVRKNGRGDGLDWPALYYISVSRFRWAGIDVADFRFGGRAEIRKKCATLCFPELRCPVQIWTD